MSYGKETWVGRHKLINSLVKKLKGGVRIIMLTGLTGIGKTALAELLVLKFFSKGAKFCRLNFDGQVQEKDFHSVALSLLEELGEKVKKQDKDDVDKVFNRLFKTLKDNRFIVQIDALENILNFCEKSATNTFLDILWRQFFEQILTATKCQSTFLLTSQVVSTELVKKGTDSPRVWHEEGLRGLSEENYLPLFKKNGLNPDEEGKKYLKRIGEIYEGHPKVLIIIAKEILSQFNGNVKNYWDYDKVDFEEKELEKKKPTSTSRLEMWVNERVKKSVNRLPKAASQLLYCSSVYRRPVSEEFWYAMIESLSNEEQKAAMDSLISHNLVEVEFRKNGLKFLWQHNLVKRVSFNFLRQDESRWQEAERIAATSWKNNNQPTSEASKLETVRGALEAFHHFCQAKDWKQAQEILIDESLNDKSLDNQIKNWGYYEELHKLYNRIKNNLDDKFKMICERRIGNLYWRQSNYQKAFDSWERSRVLAVRIGDQAGKEGEIIVLNSLGLAAYMLLKYNKAKNYYEQSLKLAPEISNDKKRLEAQGRAFNGLGLIYGALEEYGKAFKYHNKHYKIAKKLGDEQLRGQGRSLGNLGKIFRRKGHYEQAFGYLNKWLEIMKNDVKDKQEEGDALCEIGYTYFKKNDYEQAFSHLSKAFDIAFDVGDRRGEGVALRRLGQALTKLENYSEAKEYFKNSCEISKDLEHVAGESEAESLLNLAEKYLNSSCEIFKNINLLNYRSESLLRLAQLYYKKKDFLLAKNFNNEASKIFDKQKKSSLIKECEELRARLDCHFTQKMA